MSHTPAVVGQGNIVDPYTAWCREHGCDHGHCPDGCEHPAPLPVGDGKLACMRCYVKFGEVVEMVPCTPETCPE